MIKAKVICLTPVKNEEWILEKFLSSASMWADHIIVADQLSCDRSKEIASQFPKVILIDNNSVSFNEPERQKLLINEARKITGKKLLVALDADEFLSGNFYGSRDWDLMLASEPGTVFLFRWPFIHRNFHQYWAGEKCNMPLAYMDDGAEHEGLEMHSPRVPIPEGCKTIKIKDFVVMHFMYTDWERMVSKHRWYQCHERVIYPRKSAIGIFRRYTHMYRQDEKNYKNIPDEWFRQYGLWEINLKKINKSNKYYWDDLVDKMIEEYGLEYFKYIDLPQNNNLLLRYLRSTKKKNYNIFERIFDKLTGGIK